MIYRIRSELWFFSYYSMFAKQKYSIWVFQKKQKNNNNKWNYMAVNDFIEFHFMKSLPDLTLVIRPIPRETESHCWNDNIG